MKHPPQLTVLVVVFVLAAAIGLLTGVISLTTDSYEIERRVVLSSISNFLWIVAVISGVGTLVLAGVMSLLSARTAPRGES